MCKKIKILFCFVLVIAIASTQDNENESENEGGIGSFLKSIGIQSVPKSRRRLGLLYHINLQAWLLGEAPLWNSTSWAEDEKRRVDAGGQTFWKGTASVLLLFGAVIVLGFVWAIISALLQGMKIKYIRRKMEPKWK